MENVANTSAKPTVKKKPKKVDGKLNVDKVLQHWKAGKKKKDIAVASGSLANSDEALINSVNRVMRSDEFKKKAHAIIRKSYAGITDEKIDQANYTALVQGIERLSKVAGLADQQEQIVTNIIKVDIDKVLNYYATGKE